jgi:hypothetical protein
VIGTIGEWLSRDIAPWGGLYSPVLSWVGAGALMLFVVWETVRLCSEAGAARALCADVHEALARLLNERRSTYRDPLSPHHYASRSRPVELHDSRDVDDLGPLDRLMADDAALSQAWAQYRKTLVLEQVAWFQEPHIFSTRHAEEFFTFERLFARRVRQSWYSHVPSFVTGVSLLLTFVALLIGLSHVHADAQGIQGLQGLINGLAGKFLTSIVGLIGANVFSLVEKQVLFKLATAHQELVDDIEGLFPRKMLEQWVEEQQLGLQGTMRDNDRTGRPDLEASVQNLALLIQDLTHALKMQTLVSEAESDAHDRSRRSSMTVNNGTAHGGLEARSRLPSRH